MRPTKLLTAPIALVLALSLAACGAGDSSGGGGQSAQTTAAKASPQERAFLSAMVPHHRSAVAMASAAEGRLENVEIRRIQSAIAKTQTAEIGQMESIHQRLVGAPLAPDEGAHMQLGLSAQEAGMDHMMGAQPIEQAAEPVDRAFIDEMVPHHRGAVVMAEVMLERSRDPEVLKLAGGIVDAQESEITTMNEVREREFGSPVEENEGAGGDGTGHSGR